MCRVKSNCATWQNLEETNLYTSCDCFVKVVSISMFLLQLERQVVEESNVQQNIVSNSMPLFNHPPPPFMVPPMMMMRAPPPGMEFQPPLFRPPVQNPPLLTKPPGIDKPQVQCINYCISCMSIRCYVVIHDNVWLRFIFYCSIPDRSGWSRTKGGTQGSPSQVKCPHSRQSLVCGMDNWRAIIFLQRDITYLCMVAAQRPGGESPCF